MVAGYILNIHTQYYISLLETKNRKKREGNNNNNSRASEKRKVQWRSVNYKPLLDNNKKGEISSELDRRKKKEND